MIIESKMIMGKNLIWTLRCPTVEDAVELSDLRVKIDGETEFLDREPGEDLLSPEQISVQIQEDNLAARALFLVAEVEGRLVGFARCVGSKLKRFRHKAEFGICILQEYCGNGIGKVLMECVLEWADSVSIQKISLTVVQTNTNAIQLYEKLGFVEEGILVSDRIHRDGKYYNTVLMGRFGVD
jgi:RimJ/RimL family protein N-acetyltransferase